MVIPSCVGLRFTSGLFLNQAFHRLGFGIGQVASLTGSAAMSATPWSRSCCWWKACRAKESVQTTVASSAVSHFFASDRPMRSALAVIVRVCALAGRLASTAPWNVTFLLGAGA